MGHMTYDLGRGIPIFKACSGTSMILEQELQSWDGKIWIGIGLHLHRLGNTLFHSTVQLPAGSLASVEVTLTFKNLGRQTNTQTNRQRCLLSCSATKIHAT
jgi:hypothetical protein